jgi:3-deoxy-D-manno-octulosonate 8-phosphate phosphatase (KDO 8-P phosphatase)
MKDIRKKAEKIKLLILDVDGVLTDGTVFIDDDDKEMKAFNIHDGLGIKMLQRSGVDVAIISGGAASAIEHRALHLGIKYIYLAQEKKAQVFLDLKQKLNLNDDEIAYIGDDIPDLSVMKTVGFAVAVPNAVAEVLAEADFVTKKAGGFGAVREVCDLIMLAQGTLESAHQFYFEE